MFTNTVVHAHIGWKLRNTCIKNLLKATLHHFKINCMTMDVSFKCVPFSSMLNVVKTTITCTYQLSNQLSFPREYIHRCEFFLQAGLVCLMMISIAFIVIVPFNSGIYLN